MVGWWSRCAQTRWRYLPMTTEITSLPQLTPEGVPLVLARWAAEQTRMTKAEARVESSRGNSDFTRCGHGSTHLSRVRRAPGSG